MKTNKLIAAAALIAVSATGLSYSYADEELSTTTTKTVKEFQKGKFDRVELTDEQKAEMLEKREEMQAEKELKKEQKLAQEAVIDALLAGETLTADQEILRAEMIEKRAEIKEKKAEMEEKMQEIKAILEKVKAGETLSDEEQTTLDTFKAEHTGKKGNGKMNKGEGKKGGNKGERKGINKDVESETL